MDANETSGTGTTQPDIDRYEALVIGGSAAGLSAALMLGRARRRTLVIDAGRPINATVDHSHGFLTRDGIAPSELAALGRAELVPYGVEVVEGAVETLERAGDGFRAVLGDGSTVTADGVVLATGAHFDLPEIPGFAEVWGRGAGNCPYCHGWEVRDLPLGVLAIDPEHGAHLSMLLQQWSPEVTVFTQGTALPAAPTLELLGVTVETSAVVAIEHDGEGGVVGAVLTDGRTVPLGGLFLAAGMPTPNLDLAIGLGAELDEAGLPVLDRFGGTTVPGIFIAGIAATPHLTLIGSAASGAFAGAGLNNGLVMGDVARRTASV